MTTLRDEYFETLGLNGDDTSHRKRRKQALARAYELRTFEIEHYWKRATYFWGFQIAIFAAFGFIWKDADSKYIKQLSPVILALAILGVLTAYANILSAQGSRFWQRNWELHIDMLEDEFEGKLYKTVWIPKGTSYSVSKINLALGVAFMLFWVFVDVFTSIKFNDELPLSFVQVVFVIIVFLTTLFMKSNLPAREAEDIPFVQRPSPEDAPPVG